MITIIIVNWNNWQDTLECLASLDNLKYNNYRIILIDNGSTDQLRVKLKELGKKIEFIKLKKNLGFATANNIGIKSAIKQKADYILLLNNDTVVASNILEEFIKISKKYPKAAAFTGKIYYYHDKNKLWFAGSIKGKDGEFPRHRGLNEIDTGLYNEVEEIPFINGCAFLVRTNVLEDVGLLDEKYFYMYEDADWSSNFINKGYKCLFVPKVKIWHKVHNATSGRSALWWYYDSRSYLYWLKKNFPKQNISKLLIINFKDLYMEWLIKLIHYHPKFWLKEFFNINLNFFSRIIGVIDYYKGNFQEAPQFIRYISGR